MSPAEVEAWAGRCEAHVRETVAGDAAHDTAHVRRVVAWARRLAEAEGADLGVALPAAWLHDAVTVPKDAPDRARASALAAEAATEWLRREGFPADRLGAVAHAIEAHSWSAGIEPRTVEAAVVQDADRLDALGAIGVARLYATAGALGSALAHPTDPVPAEPPTRPLDDRRWATDHLFVKVLRLPATMRTAAGRAEAERRVAFLHTFLRQLATEVG
ncbi:HD domain-containing protein [Rubrivirga sp.]|uniref:HD domain-containing protein n=1 Tax=Rubrivirga sp. TaxID=1885344 RepID=UPI003B51A06A